MSSRPAAVLFDLDGTLTDSGPGILASLRFALTELGLPMPDDATLRAFVGPPLTDTLRDICGLDDAGVRDAIVVYRRYFTTRGMFENRVYDGIADLLAALQSAGRRLALATSKPLPFAQRICDHFGLTPFFQVLCGADLEGHRATKDVVVADALAALDLAAGPHVVMVGDREHDVQGALANGIDCLGVSWGYGSRAELAAAGAVAIADDVEQLASLLGVTQDAAYAPSVPSAGDEARA